MKKEIVRSKIWFTKVLVLGVCLPDPTVKTKTDLSVHSLSLGAYAGLSTSIQHLEYGFVA